MALTQISLGTTANDGTGTSLRAAGALINTAFAAIDTNTTALAGLTPSSDVAFKTLALTDSLSIKSGGAPYGTIDASLINSARGYQLPDISGAFILNTHRLDHLSVTTSAQLAAVISDETGGGALVFATSPTLVTPLLGTPTSGTLTNCTGLPLTSGVTGILPGANGGTGIANTSKTITIGANFLTTGTSGVTLAAPSTGSPIVYTLPTTAATLARTDSAQTFAGIQTFSSPIALTYGSTGMVLQSTNGTSVGGIYHVTNSTMSIGTTSNNHLGFFSNNSSTTALMLDTSQRVSIGVAAGSATAYLHIKAGVATANNGAPLKFTSGTNLTTPENGAFEYNGTNLFFTRAGAVRETNWCGNDGASAPSTSALTAFTNYYGTGGTVALATPNSWASVVIGGTTYKVPLYT